MSCLQVSSTHLASKALHSIPTANWHSPYVGGAASNEKSKWTLSNRPTHYSNKLKLSCIKKTQEFVQQNATKRRSGDSTLLPGIQAINWAVARWVRAWSTERKTYEYRIWVCRNKFGISQFPQKCHFSEFPVTLKTNEINKIHNFAAIHFKIRNSN